MRPTIDDIARLTGLAPGTVSRALSAPGKYHVSEKTRQKVADAASELGYRPNLIGRALAAGSSGLVSLLVPMPFSSYYTAVARHLSLQAARHGYCLVNDCAIDPQMAAKFVVPKDVPHQEWLYGVDGILVCDLAPWHIEYVREAIRLKIPLVGMGVVLPKGVDTVRVEILESARKLMRHLVDRKARSIAIITGYDKTPDPRTQAYREILRETGIPERLVLIENQRREDGRKAISDDIRENGRPDAVFCVNDEVAIGAYRGLIDLGLRVPEDVLLAGCDGIEEAEYQYCPITTLVQPFAQMCELAWARLQARMEDDKGPLQQLETHAQLEIRRSTGLV